MTCEEDKWTLVRKECDICNQGLTLHDLNRYCGAYICTNPGCDDNHVGLARCYCGWSRSGGDGRAELQEDGEQLEPDY